MTKESIVDNRNEWDAERSGETLQDFIASSEGYRVILKGDFGENLAHHIGHGSFVVESAYGPVKLGYSGMNAFGSGNMEGRVTSASRVPLWADAMVVCDVDGLIWVRLDNGLFSNTLGREYQKEVDWQEMARLHGPVKVVISSDGTRNSDLLSGLPFSYEDPDPQYLEDLM